MRPVSSRIDGPSALAALRDLCRVLDGLKPPSLLWRAGSVVLVPAALGLGGGCGACEPQEPEPAPPPTAVVDAGAPDAPRPTDASPATDSAPDGALDGGESRDADRGDASPDADAGPVEVCDDRTDNDGDGRVDCRDPDCRETVRCERARQAREIRRMMEERSRPRPLYGVDMP
jgi:hypothetical protein